MRFVRWGAVALVMLFVTAPAAPALAQAGGITLSTEFPGIVVKPGDSPGFTVHVGAQVGTTVDLAVTDLPDGWTSTLRGASLVVDRTTIVKGTVDSNGVILDTGVQDVRLELAVPADTPDGDYQVTLQGSSPAGSDTLTVSVTVSAAVSGGVTLGASYPDLRGSPDTDFTYSLDLENNTAEEIQFDLAAQGPTGWTIDVKPTAQSRAATVTLAAGAKTSLIVSVNPPNDTPAGTYQILVTASGATQTVDAQLTAEVTGNYAMTLITADQRLNASVHAGAESTVALQIINTGTAPLDQVSLSATPPNGWNVTFQPTGVVEIAPGASADVTAVIKASPDAVAGDYRLTLKANVPEVSDQIEMRVTVQTSALWGFVGIALVVLALGGLGVVFWRLGRR